MFTASRARPRSTELVTLLALTIATAIALSLPNWGFAGPGPVPAGVPNPDPSPPSVNGLVTHDLATGGETPASLVQALVGTGAVVSNIQYTGAPIAAGTFTGGDGIIGFEQGIILSTGNIAGVVGPMNTTFNTTTENGMPGDADQDALWGPTRDASVLEFDLECPAGTAMSFQYVFASSEYDFAASGIIEAFACFLNGQNIALIPGTNSPIAVSTVNCGQPFGPPSGSNCAFYRTNSCYSLGLGYPCSHIATEMDGLTVVLSATGTLQPGSNHIKLVIADYFDEIVDSNVFIRGQSLVCARGAPVFETPSSCDLIFDGWPGVPFSFETAAWAANLLPGESITLDVTGDAIPLAGGTFFPPLPTGPAQPGATQFQWTPTLADVGFYHLVFTATDQLQHSASLDVPVRISISGPPIFDTPSPCAQVLDATLGTPFSFGIQASAWSSAECGTIGAPGQSVTLSVTGDATPLAGGTFVPPLPAGPAQPVSTQFHWAPTPADAGLYHLQFTAIDQLQQSSSCDVTIRVSFPSPVFEALSPCSQTLDAYTGVPMSFEIAASAMNGLPGEAVTVSVSGDPAPLAGGTFVPPLPAGPAQLVSTRFDWIPTLADIGVHQLDFTATDQLQGTVHCGVQIRVRRTLGVDLCLPGVGGVMACPCGNPPASALRGCDNSSGTGGARLNSAGSASISQDTVHFTTEGQSPTALGLLFQGNVQIPGGIVFGQGVRCSGGLIKRLFAMSASGGSITAPPVVGPTISSRSASRGDPIQPGTSRLYAVYYRDNTILGGCPASAVFNITQTQEILWNP